MPFPFPRVVDFHVFCHNFYFPGNALRQVFVRGRVFRLGIVFILFFQAMDVSWWNRSVIIFLIKNYLLRTRLFSPTFFFYVRLSRPVLWQPFYFPLIMQLLKEWDSFPREILAVHLQLLYHLVKPQVNPRLYVYSLLFTQIQVDVFLTEFFKRDSLHY
jgi:hypothetical protein